MSNRGNNVGYNILSDIIGMPEYHYENSKATFDPVPNVLRLSGKGNYAHRQDFANKIAAMDDDKFGREAETYIWLSAWAANNINSDYHWQADACYHEAQRRGNPDLYKHAWERAAGKS